VNSIVVEVMHSKTSYRGRGPKGLGMSWHFSPPKKTNHQTITYYARRIPFPPQREVKILLAVSSIQKKQIPSIREAGRVFKVGTSSKTGNHSKTQLLWPVEDELVQ
jgi:hypothetical protein